MTDISDKPEPNSFENVLAFRMNKEVRVYVGTTRGDDTSWDIRGKIIQVLEKTIVLERTGWLQWSNRIAIDRSRIVAIGWNA